jgi:hypothetical protein
VRVPGSKSISNRVLLMAALANGVCRISGLLHSDDTKVSKPSETVTMYGDGLPVPVAHER